jgi:hypothetical protein
MKEARELHTLLDQLEAHIREQAEQIDSLQKTVEALAVACEQTADKERDKCAADYLQDCCDAVDAARLEEREACAQLCDDEGRVVPYEILSKQSYRLANLIRARGNHG